MTSPAHVLRELARLIEDKLDRPGIPAPKSIHFPTAEWEGDQPRVHVDKADLTPWLAALGLDEPEWHGVASDPMMFAHWPAGAFDGKPFKLVCISVEPVAVA